MFSRIKSLAQHTAVYGMGDLLGRAVSILLVPIYARHLTPADNGILSLAFAFIGFSAVFILSVSIPRWSASYLARPISANIAPHLAPHFGHYSPQVLFCRVWSGSMRRVSRIIFWAVRITVRSSNLLPPLSFWTRCQNPFSRFVALDSDPFTMRLCG